MAVGEARDIVKEGFEFANNISQKHDEYKVNMLACDERAVAQLGHLYADPVLAARRPAGAAWGAPTVTP